MKDVRYLYTSYYEKYEIRQYLDLRNCRENVDNTSADEPSILHACHEKWDARYPNHIYLLNQSIGGIPW